MRLMQEMRMRKRARAAAIGFLLLTFLTAASKKGANPPPALAQDPAASASSLEEELKSFEQQLGTATSAESLFANGRAPDLVVISSTDVHGEVEPCG